MKQDPKFTEQLQAWMNTPDSQKNWEEGALLLLQLSGNRIMYRNISFNPKGKAEFIKGQLQKYLNFRLQQLTKDQVNEMQSKVDEIVEKVIKPAETNEFAEFKAGKRADHDSLPAEVQALYVENLDLVHRMRELHLKLRTLSLDNATCPDSERYPFLKELIALDKKRVANWDIYDHFVIGVSPVPESVAADTEAVVDNPEGLTDSEPAVTGPEASAEGKEAPEPAPKPAKSPKTAGRKPKANSKKPKAK